MARKILNGRKRKRVSKDPKTWDRYTLLLPGWMDLTENGERRKLEK